MPKYVIDLQATDWTELQTLTDEKADELNAEVDEAEEGDERTVGTSMEEEGPHSDLLEQRDAFERISNALNKAQILDEPE